MPSSARLQFLLGSVRYTFPLFLYVAILATPGWELVGAQEPARHSQGKVKYSRDILPILSQKCFVCHGLDEEARQADLRLDQFEFATSDEATGTASIVPGKPSDSELLRRVSSSDPDLRMPPEEHGESLTSEQVATLRQWISEGAEYQSHWAFEKPTSPELPPNLHGDSSHPVDRFIHRRLTQSELSPSTRADHAALLRRLSLDLIGLPPSLAELDRFLAAAKIDFDSAYASEVDRLLKSPHYGERWGRWWLDQARYADSNGYSIDGPRKIWKYRDWVIEAFNSDLPFDEFTIQQLAGDLLPNATQNNRVATGFHRNTQINQEGGIDREQFRIDSVFDRVATTGTVWMGLTIGCAQCHDHKFDPISQVEYYQLFAFFNNQDELNLEVHADLASLPARRELAKKTQSELSDWLQTKRSNLQAWLAELDDSKREKLPGDLKKLLEKEGEKWSSGDLEKLFAQELAKSIPEFRELTKARDAAKAATIGVTTMVLAERKTQRTSHLLIKGDFTRPDLEVSPATPSVLHPMIARGDAPDRLDLANWIVHPDNPLTSRVIVNRVWQIYFGRGLVETENDFGTLGTQATHPELLDWLAVNFQKGGWRLKELHRLIVTSDTYQQSSNERADLHNKDPNNLLLGRQTRLRLEAELIRDLSLHVSGLLAPKIGGPPVYPPIPPGVMNRGQVNRSWKASQGDDRYRRAIYTFVYRATPPPSLNVFDAPDGFSSCTRRSRSNTPLQALTLLNDQAFSEFAAALEKRIESEGVAKAFRICTGRVPEQQELEVLDSLDTSSAARVLLNLDETVTRN